MQRDIKTYTLTLFHPLIYSAPRRSALTITLYPFNLYGICMKRNSCTTRLQFILLFFLLIYV